MKQTKKLAVILLCLCLMLSCIFALASCGGCSHSETEWVVVKEATATEDGQKNEVCKDCDEILSTDKIPATGNPDPEIVAVPTSLKLDGTTFTWDAVEGATGYVVKVNDTTYDVTTTSFDLSTITLTANTRYAVSVKAVKADGSSEFCSAVTANYLTKNFALSYAKNTVSWDYVIGASNYEVKVNGSDAVPVTDTNSAKITLTKSGDNLVEVRYTNGEGSDWMQLTVKAYTVTYNSRSLDGGEEVEYLATGDEMTLPAGEYTNIGYDFAGWYTAETNGDKYEDKTIFTATEDLMVYGGWTPRQYTLNLNVEGYGVTNVAPDATKEVTYNENFTLPVPVPADENNVFAGWYTTQFASGTKVADELGNSTGVAKFTQTTTLYAVFISNVLDYALNDDDTYSVTAGPNFDKISNLTIPVTYAGKPVKNILENAFESRKLLVSIRIPDTIDLVGSGAFNGASSLESIEIYEVEGNHERKYASYDGALIRNDMGTITLEVFPRAKTGTFTTPAGVTTIRNKVFQYSNIEKVIISKDVTAIYERAFYGCKRLHTVEFEGGRETDVVLMCGTSDKADSIFYSTPNITSISFPAKLAEFNYTYVLNQLTKLTTITVEDGGVVYSAVGGMLTNGDEDTILYAPLNVIGDFTVPDGIVAIGANAFNGRTGLSSITVPMFVEEIGANAFYGCKGVKTVTIEGKRYIDLAIGSNAFAACTSLKSVVIGGNDSDTELDEGVISIGASAFAPEAGAASIETVTFGKGVKISTIGNNAFKNQSKIRALNFASNLSITAIGTSAFEGTKITSLQIPASVTSIGASAFKGCSELKTVTFNEGSSGNITFGDSAFANCAKITSVFLPSTVTAFDGTVFNGCSSLTKIEVDKNNTSLKSDDNGVLYDFNITTLIYYPRGLAVDKASIDKLPWNTITTIGNAAFSGHATLESFEIKKGITKIGVAAFSNCTALKTLSFEPGAAAGTTLVIELNAFANCQKLDSVSIPDYTTKIGEAAFLNATFASFDMPSSVTTIGQDAFKYNSHLASINIPAKVTSIGAGAFSNCTALAEVIVDDSTGASLFKFEISGSKGTFLSCTALTSIDLKNRATNIGPSMFKNSGLTSITLGSNVTSIGSYAFQNTKITSINIPANVTEIGIGAFATEASKTVYLEEVTFDEGTASLTINNNAFENANITAINFPARLTKLGADVKAGTGTVSYINVSGIPEIFKGCENLVDITVTSGNSNYMDIEGVLYAKSNGVPVTLLLCPPQNEGVLVDGVKTITVPKTVTLVENRALFDVRKIKTVTFEEYDDTDPKHNEKLLSIGRDNGTLNPNIASTNNAYAVIGGHYYEVKEPQSNGLTATVKYFDNSITTINIPSHISIFGKYGIATTKDIVTLNIPDDAIEISIAYYAFNSAKIVKYNFPGVKAVAQHAFSGAFNGFTATKKVNGETIVGEQDTLPFEVIFGEASTLTVLSAHCFNGSKIESFVVPASVVETSNTFYNSTRLKTVSFAPGSKIKTIGAQTFGLCAALTSVDFSNAKEFETFNGANIFQNCTSLTSFEFPENTKFVPNNFFTGSNKVEVLTLNKTFTPEMLYDINTSNQQTAVFGSFSTGSTMPAFKEFRVDPENPHFKVVDGVLYSADMTTLYCYPAARPIEGFTIPSTVTTIAHYAFQHYQGESLEIPDTVAFIGDFAFRYSNLKTVDVGPNVGEIGMYAFANCTKLTSVSFDNDNTVLTKIGAYAFSGDNILASVNNIPDTVTTIDKYAFQSCYALTSITLPSALTKISDYMFSGCSGLTSVEIQQSITEIGMRAFYNNSKLTEIEIPAGVATIGTEAFYGNTSLVDVDIDDDSKLTIIGAKAFENCAKLETINLPDTVTEFTTYTDSFDKAFSYSNTFKGCASLKSISIPSVLDIPDSTFEGCVSLETVVLGDELSFIGVKAFYNNNSLLSINIPASVMSIGTSAFENCYAMTTLTFEDGSSLRTLGTSETANDNIFKNTTSLESVTLPTSITLIGGHVFENSAISAVNIGSLTSLDTIGDYAFANCDNIVDLVIGTSVAYLGDYAFFDCDNLETPSLTFGVEYFGELAFGSCDKITDGYIPATVFTLNGNPYAGCPGVTALRIDEDNAELLIEEDGSVYDADKTVLHYYSATNTTATVVLPTTVTKIAPGAFAGSQVQNFTFLAKYGKIEAFTFYGCKKLASVSIIDGITSIGDYAFYGCEKLNNVTIPSSATVATTDWSKRGIGHVLPTTLGDYAFANCASLSNVTFATTDRIYTIGTHFFENCTAMTEIKLPTNFSITDRDAEKLGTKFYTVNVNGYVNRYEPMKHVIPAYMFAGTGIVNAVIPANIYYLETDGVFMNCQDLETVTFEAPAADPSKNATTNANAGKLSYVYIGNYMFYNCDSLVTIEIPNSNAANPLNNTIGYTFAECDNLETVILYCKPAATTTPTNEGMFMNCKKLKTLTIYNVSKVVSGEGDTGSEDNGGSDDSGNVEEEAPDIGGIGDIVIPFPGIGALNVTNPVNTVSVATTVGSANKANTSGFELSTSTIGSIAVGEIGDADETDVEEEPVAETTTTPSTSNIGAASGSIGSVTTPGAGSAVGGGAVEEAPSEDVTTPGASTPGASTPGAGSAIGGIGGTVIGPVGPGAGGDVEEEEGEDNGGSSEGTTPEDVEYAESYLDYIGNNYFKGCESLEEITIMNNAYIGDSAFEGCTSLKEVTFYDPNAETGGDSGSGGSGSDDSGNVEEEAPDIGGIGGIVIPLPGIGGLSTTPVTTTPSSTQNNANTLGLGAIGSIGTTPGAGGAVGGGDVEEAPEEEAPSIGGIVINPTPGGNITPGGSEDAGEEEEGGSTAPAAASLKHLGNNAFKGCTALTSITLPGIPENAGTGVFDGWTAEQTINLSNTEAELAEQVANGLFEGCEATVNYSSEA